MMKKLLSTISLFLLFSLFGINSSFAVQNLTGTPVVTNFNSTYNIYTISPDGTWMIYQGSDFFLYKMNMATGVSTKFSDVTAQYPTFSPDGLWVSYKDWAIGTYVYKKQLSTDYTSPGKLMDTGIFSELPFDSSYLWYIKTNSSLHYCYIYKKLTIDNTNSGSLSATITDCDLTKFDINNGYLYYRVWSSDTLRKYNLSTNTSIGWNGTLVNYLAGIINGNLIYKSASDGYIYKKSTTLNDSTNGTVIANWNSGFSGISPDGTAVFSASWGGATTIYKEINGGGRVAENKFTNFSITPDSLNIIYSNITNSGSIWIKAIASGADGVKIGNAGKVLSTGSGFAYYSTGTTLYKLFTTPVCVGTLPTPSNNISSYSVQTGSLTVASTYQNTNAGDVCYYTPVCKSGYTGSSCTSLTSPITSTQEFINLYNNGFGSYYGYHTTLSNPGTVATSNYQPTTGANAFNFKPNNAGTKGYVALSNGTIYEVNVTNFNGIRIMATDGYFANSMFNSYMRNIVLSYDDKRLYYQSYDGMFFYINKVDVTTGIGVKYLKSITPIYTWKESPDGLSFFWRNNSDGGKLYKKPVVATDMNSLGSIFTSVQYSGYDVNFTADGMNVLYGNSTVGIYKKPTISDDSNSFGTQITNSSYYSYGILESPDKKYIIYFGMDSYLYRYDELTGITTKTNFYLFNPYSIFFITEDSKYVVYYNYLTGYYYISPINSDGIGIQIVPPISSIPGYVTYNSIIVLPKAPVYYTPPIFKGKEVWNEDKINQADSLEVNKALNQTSKDVILYQTGGIFGASDYLYTPSTKLTNIISNLNSNGFITSGNQNVFTIKVGGRAITIKIAK